MTAGHCQHARRCGVEQLLICVSFLLGSGVTNQFPGGRGGAAQTGAEDFRAEQRRALCGSERVPKGENGDWSEWN